MERETRIPEAPKRSDFIRAGDIFDREREIIDPDKIEIRRIRLRFDTLNSLVPIVQSRDRRFPRDKPTK